MPVVLGVDSSVHSTRVELRDADTGRVVSEGVAAHPPPAGPRREQDPQAWWQALLDARRQTGSPIVAAVAVAAQQHGLVALDEDHRIVRPALVGDDVESALDAKWLVEQLDGPRAWVDRCGTVPNAALTVSKLSWLHRSEPDHFARTARVLLPHDWLTARIVGRFVTDRGDASGTGYWSPKENRYLPEVLALVDSERDWGRSFPKVLDPSEPAGEREGSIAAPGTGASMAAALGLGLRPGDVAVMIGDTGMVCAVSNRATKDDSGAVAGFADATGRFLPQVHVRNTVEVTDAVARLLNVDRAGLDQLALASEPGAGGVVLVPYFDGARTPDEAEATGALTGLRSDVTPEQVARAAVEGVVCSLLEGVDAIAAQGVPVDGRFVLFGAAARSHAYQQVLADLAQRPVEVPRGEHVVLGACVQAAAVLQSRPPQDVAAAWELGGGRVVEPEPDIDVDGIRARYTARRG